MAGESPARSDRDVIFRRDHSGARGPRSRAAGRGVVGAALLLVLGVGVGGPRPAAADAFDEREQQLKALGIDDDLRPRIHRVIGVGSHALVGLLANGVKIRGAAKASVPIGTGPSILATLALAHSRTAESAAAAKAWVQRLLVVDPLAAQAAETDTYMAGIVGLL